MVWLGAGRFAKHSVRSGPKTDSIFSPHSCYLDCDAPLAPSRTQGVFDVRAFMAPGDQISVSRDGSEEPASARSFYNKPSQLMLLVY